MSVGCRELRLGLLPLAGFARGFTRRAHALGSPLPLACSGDGAPINIVFDGPADGLRTGYPRLGRLADLVQTAARREELAGREIARRAEDDEPADHRVSTLIKFVIPGRPTGTPAVMTTVSPRCTHAAASAAPRAPSISASVVGWL